MGSTDIQWTDRVWNVMRGCRRVSPGCGGPGPHGGCYAEQLAGRQSNPGGAYEGLVQLSKGNGFRWTGEGRFAAYKLKEPLRARKPYRWFVNSMSDLFFEAFTNEQIAAVFGVMAACPTQTFQVLTKRPKRMREWFEWISSTIGPLGNVESPELACQRHAHRLLGDAFPLHKIKGTFKSYPWPLLNVWIGVSVEDQQRADDRIPLLLETPAAVRFVSIEPMLEEISLFAFLKGETRDRCLDILGGSSATPGLDWVIVGGESGRRARPFDIAWARSLRDQCHEASVSYFLKQLGAFPVEEREVGTAKGGSHVPLELKDSHGGDPGEWPRDLVGHREFPLPRCA